MTVYRVDMVSVPAAPWAWVTLPAEVPCQDPKCYGECVSSAPWEEEGEEE